MRAAKLFVALARFGSLAFEAITRLALTPSPGICLLAAAIVLLRRTRIDQRSGARFALLGAQGGQDDAGLGRWRCGRLGRRDRSGPGRGGKRARSSRRRRGGRRRRRSSRSRGRFGRRQHPPLYLLDDDRLAAAVRKALPHRTLLNRTLQVQRRLRRSRRHCLIAITRLTHATS